MEKEEREQTKRLGSERKQESGVGQVKRMEREKRGRAK